ncbi:BQ2448_1305 [Microbotryum intermedium]|uniref:BQ2448_1305 protein n=1 Tax=Microbotryum intermedium TaxID=269621 RepID=A0A238FCR4_9BASI|nr:BQ2448_1305 [Microbotryum intermedium]
MRGRKCPQAALTIYLNVSGTVSIWTPFMYGVGWATGNKGSKFSQQAGDFAYNAGAPANYRALRPRPGRVAKLSADGKWTVEIACHVAWTSYGVSTTTPGSNLDACPGNSGAYHSGDPSASTIDSNMLSGCALGIADVDGISKVTMDNLVIFSTNQKCVASRYTNFKIPALMPACTGAKCICGWFWLANNGTANFYMTAFDCAITNVLPQAQSDLHHKLPIGSKRPLYAYNTPSTVVFVGNDDRPGYHANWGFPIDGAQDDIFQVYGSSSTTTATTTTSPSSSSSPTSTSSSTSVLATTASAIPTSSPSSSSTTTTGDTTVSTEDVTTTTPSATTTKSATPTTTTTTTTTSSVPLPTGPVVNLARSASADASSFNGLTSSSPDKAIDGNTKGAATDTGTLDIFPILSGAAATEWVSFGQGQGAWFSSRDRIFTATITFADGSSIPISSLNNQGLATYFNTTTITTMSFKLNIQTVSGTTANIGLAEIQVFFKPTTGFNKILTPTPKSSKRSVVVSSVPARHPRDFTTRRDTMQERIFEEASGSRLVERCSRARLRQ